MSEYSDILFDPRSNTHESCIKEVSNCDMVVLIIGSRFGGTGIPSASDCIDFDTLKTLSSKAELLEYKGKLSITQLEILRAAEQSIPVYTFIDTNVFHDHHVYEINKGNPEIVNAIEFPSIQKKETAKYIFEFINFLTHRTQNNSITQFSRLNDIKEILLGQWSQLFHKLLSETRNSSIESKIYMEFSERLADLKALIMASITTPKLRDTAKGAIQFRHLLTFLSSFNTPNLNDLLLSDYSWLKLLQELEIREIKAYSKSDIFGRPDLFLVRNDGTFYRCRYPLSVMDDMKDDWSKFVQTDRDSRTAIVAASLEDIEIRRFRPVIHVNKNFEEFIENEFAKNRLDLDVDS